jgi:hypothetical protein
MIEPTHLLVSTSGTAIATATAKQPRHDGTDSKWQTFEDLGLEPSRVTTKARSLLVWMYRLLGFVILTAIVAILIGYISTTVFYYFNQTWTTPIALSANDEKVVALESQHATLLNEREKLVAELAEAERAIDAEQNFQLQFAKAIKKDAAGRRMAFDRVQQLAVAASIARQRMHHANEAFSRSATSKMEKDYQAKLIDQSSLIAAKMQLAQISNSNLSVVERQAEYDQRATELAAQTRALDALLTNKAQSAALSYDVLKIAREYEASKRALARELGNRERLQASIARQDKIIEGVTQSAYLRAVTNNATVALVPYGNLDNIEKGTPLYACRFKMLWCREVGTVLEVLPGEVSLKHPMRDQTLRGRMIETQLTDTAAAQGDVLFAGKPPLGF